MSGGNREPSSSVKKATASGRGSRAPAVLSVSDHLQPGQHAQVAVVAAAGADGVDVAAGHHRRPVAEARIRGDHVADGVHRDR